MAIEQKWPAVPPSLFTANGDAYGNIQIANTAGFKVKQAVTIKATGLPDLFVQVKRATRTRLIVGPIQAVPGKESLQSRTDLSLYTVAAGAFIFAEEQVKAKIKPDDIIQAVYRQEPGTTIGVEIDDQYGNPIDSVVDNNGINRLCVDGQFTAVVDVQVDVDIDGVYDPTENPDPDNIGLIGHTRNVNPTEVQQVQRITVKQGTVDTDVRAMDVSIHDEDGNAYTPENPFPVEIFDGPPDKDGLQHEYNEISAVASGVETTVLTVTATVQKRIQKIEASGDNVAEIRIKLNGITVSKKRIWHCDFNATFNFEQFVNGFKLVPTDVLTVTALHTRPDLGSFEATAWYL